MGKQVKFTGTTGGAYKARGSVVVDDVELPLSKSVEVSDELAKELLSGTSERLKGFKFEDAKAESPAPTPPDKQ